MQNEMQNANKFSKIIIIMSQIDKGRALFVKRSGEVHF